MKRMELIANRSVEGEIIGSLEDAINNFHYTLIPVLNGRGKRDYKLGTATWPETNFMLIAYIEDEMASIAYDIVQKVKEHFPNEGIKIFIIDVNIMGF